MKITTHIKELFFGNKQAWRSDPEYRKWNNSCLKRDSKKCRVTGRKEDLAVHHIFDASTYKMFRFSIWNGVTLNKNVHIEYHAWNGGTRKTCNWFSWQLFLLKHYTLKSFYTKSLAVVFILVVFILGSLL